MLTEERHSVILEELKKKRSVELSELCGLLDASESTVRRDLSLLDEKGALVKVRGGAIAADESFSSAEPDIEEKSRLFTSEKEAIARFAAGLIDDGDFVFIDAGTTTGRMIDFIPEKNVTFVTNAFVHAKKLAQRGFRVLIPGGEIKLSTEAIVGADCVLGLQNYNFTKSFIGVNGISLSGGFSTPDSNEAAVKTAAINNSRISYILADHSKFENVTSVKFADLNKCKIVTDRLKDKKYHAAAAIKEVL